MASPPSQFVLQVNGHEEPMPSLEALEVAFVRAQSLPHADVWLFRRLPATTGLAAFVERLVGLSNEVIGPSVSALLGPRGAAVTFLDENFSERRVVNPEPQAARERLPFVLANGQEALVAMGEVVPQDVARTALRYFFENGQAPSTFTYREAK